MLAPLAVIVVLAPIQILADVVVVVTEPEVYKLFISQAVKARFQMPMSSSLPSNGAQCPLA